MYYWKKKLGPSSKMSCGRIYRRHPQEQNFVLKNPHELGESIIILNKEKTFSFSNNHSISLAFPFFLKYCCNCMIYKYKTVVAILSESEITLYLWAWEKKKGFLWLPWNIVTVSSRDFSWMFTVLTYPWSYGLILLHLGVVFGIWNVSRGAALNASPLP